MFVQIPKMVIRNIFPFLRMFDKNIMIFFSLASQSSPLGLLTDPGSLSGAGEVRAAGLLPQAEIMKIMKIMKKHDFH